MKILFLSRWYPCPADNGSKIRVDNLLRGLVRHHEVTFISFVDASSALPQQTMTDMPARKIITVPWHEFRPNTLHAQAAFMGRTPRSLVVTHSPQMARRIQAELNAEAYDLVIASQWTMASYYTLFGRTPGLFEEVELGLFYDMAYGTAPITARMRHRLTWLKQRRYLARLLDTFQACSVVSAQERMLLQAVAPEYRAVSVIPNGINVTHYDDGQNATDPEPKSMIFTGSFRYAPNYAAICWFLRNCYSDVKAAAPEAHLIITGDHQDRPLPPAPDVELTGYVDDVRPSLRRAWVSLAPLHSGGGTRLKILEAMAVGTPVVATTKGAEGLDVRHNEHLLIADQPAAFSAAVLRLFHEPELRARLVRNARRLVQSTYDWEVVMPHFLDLIDTAARRPRGSL